MSDPGKGPSERRRSRNGVPETAARKKRCPIFQAGVSGINPPPGSVAGAPTTPQVSTSTSATARGSKGQRVGSWPTWAEEVLRIDFWGSRTAAKAEKRGWISRIFMNYQGISWSDPGRGASRC